MEKFPRFSIEAKTLSSNQYSASIVISPLKHGFGITLGNALRRVLISSIPGVAVFEVKINSLSHEFTAIEGVLEDVTTIVLRLKKLVISVDEKVLDLESWEEKPINEWPSLKVNKNKVGVVYARDIECPPGMKIINGDMKLCELTADIPFDMEIYAASDRGYRSFQENRERLNTLKIISIDSMFSPVVAIEWHVVEEKTTKQGITDQLHLTVVTNGSIKAVDAISLAAKTLTEMLVPIVNFNPEMLNKKIISDAEYVPKRTVMATPIDDLELTMRSFNCLKQNGINTIPELVNMTLAEIEQFKNLGKKSLNEIKSKLAERGLKFKGSN